MAGQHRTHERDDRRDDSVAREPIQIEMQLTDEAPKDTDAMTDDATTDTDARADTDDVGAEDEAVDVLELIMSDHREVEALFARIEQADASEREPLVAELVTALRIHMAIEEDLLYPLLESVADDEIAAEAEAEHELARHGVDDLLRLTPDEPGFDGAVAMLKAGILHHVEEEEQEALPQLRERLDDEERLDLGRQAATAKREMLASGGPPDGGARGKAAASTGTRAASGKRNGNGNGHRAGSRNGSGKNKGSGGTQRSARNGGSDEPTKDELLDQARERGISGVSRMNKQELLEALGKR